MICRRAQHFTAVWLGCAAALLLSLATVFLLHSHHAQMKEMREQAAQTRARLMAQSIGQNLAQAMSVGIPLHKLVGVPEFLERWQKKHPEVTHIAVHDDQGNALWQSHSAESPSSDTPITTGISELLANGMTRASVSLQMQSDSFEDPRRALTLLGPAILLISSLAYLAAHFSCAQGPWLRNHGFRIIARWAARGDYRRLLVLSQHKSFDLRVQELAHAMRRVHERMARMRQLISSLRRTEPQQLRRDYLDQILKKTIDKDHFTDNEPKIVQLVAVQSQSRWMALLLCLGAISPLAFSLRFLPYASSNAEHWDQALPAASLAFFILAAAAGSGLSARLRISTLSVLLLSNTALALPLLALVLGSEIHPCWIAIWNGCFAGAAMAACTCAQTHPDQHPEFVHTQPLASGAVLLAWWGCLLWLAPALGYYAYEAFPNTLAELALLLPIICVLFFATRWDVAHSPWRVRMRPDPAPLRAHKPQGLLPLGMALGLVAGQTLYDISASSSPALLQQCALGLGLGLIWIRRPVREKAHSRRWQAIALATVALQLGAAVADNLLLPWSVLSQLLLGLLIGHGLAQRIEQDSIAQRLLLCGAAGALLCAAAILLGLQAWPNAIAALLLARIPEYFSQRRKVPNVH